jgi:uncharacterized membrane protein
MSNQQNRSQIKEYIIDVVKNSKPATLKELIQLIQQKYALSQEEITNLIFQLEKENIVNFTKSSEIQLGIKKTYIISKGILWFWLTLALSILTVVAVFVIPEDTYPLTYLRQFAGVIFVMLLPGYAFMKVLFPQKMPIATATKNIDMLERISLSIGLSIALVSIDGLILNYTPWGIRLTPITLSLFLLTVVLASIGVFRELTQK